MAPKRGARGSGRARGGSFLSRKRKGDESASTGYYNNPSGPFLVDDKPTITPNYKEISEDEILAHLTALSESISATTTSKQLTLQLVAGNSEAEYISKFALDNVIVSEALDTAFERIISVSGDSKTVTRTALLISFHLAKLNNCQGKYYHVNSTGYQLTVLFDGEFLDLYESQIESLAANTAINIDVSRFGFGFGDARSVYLRGSLAALSNFLVILSGLVASAPGRKTPTLSRVPIPIIGVYGTQTGYIEALNRNILNKSFRQLWEKLHPGEKSELTTREFFVDVLRKAIIDVKSGSNASKQSSGHGGYHGHTQNLGNGGSNSQAQVIKHTIQCPSDLSGVIMGKGGSTLNEIRNKSNCSIKYIDSDKKERESGKDDFSTLQLNGIPESIIRALGLVLELFDE